MADVAIGSANISIIQLTETTTPATGGATRWKLYVKTTGLYVKDDGGTEWFVGGAAWSSIDINGGTIDGAVIGGSSPAAGTFTTLVANTEAAISGAVATTRALYYRTSGSNRWVFYTDSSNELGANGGSNFQIGAYSDAGGFLNNYVSITRSNGNINFTGTMSKGGGSFLIDHPLDPANRNLIHSFVEGPRAELIYRGRVPLVGGQAVVDIDAASGMTPGTFAALTKHTAADIFLQNQSGYVAVRGTLAGGLLTIQAQNAASTDTIAWMVVAERNDAFYRACTLTDADGNFVVETDKPEPTPEELGQLQPIEGNVSEITRELIPLLVGKRGYPMHGRLTNLAVPEREIRPRPRNGQAGGGKDGKLAARNEVIP